MSNLALIVIPLAVLFSWSTFSFHRTISSGAKTLQDEIDERRQPELAREEAAVARRKLQQDRRTRDENKRRKAIQDEKDRLQASRPHVAL